MERKKNSQSLASRVVVIISIFIIIILANVITSYILSSKMTTQVSNVKNIDLKYTLAAEKAFKSFMTIDDNTLYLAAAPDNTDPELIKTTVEAIKQGNEDLQSAVNELKDLSSSLNETDKKDIEATVKAANNYMSFNNNVLSVGQNNPKQAYQYMYVSDEESKTFFPLSDALTKLTKDAEKNTNQHADSAISFGRAQNLIVGVFGVVSVLFGIGIAYYIRRSILPLRLVSKKLQTVGEGNFTEEDIELQSQNEIGDIAQAVNTMKHNLRQVIERVGYNAEQVAAASEELSASSEQTSATTKRITEIMSEVSAGSEEQANSTKFGLQLIQGMASKLQEVAEHAQGSARSTVQATEIADKGQASIHQAMNQMNSINDTSQSLTVVVKDLGNHSKEIGQITNVIQSISTQTNLLALNAAIEAARAGEHGKGFAVVADEVRKLAEQSNHFTEQVLELVTTIQNKTVEAIEAAEETNKEMSAGIESVRLANGAFEEIHHSVSEVGQRINQVAAFANEMSLQSSQIVDSIQSIAKVAEGNSASTQHVSSSTREQLAAMEEITSAALSLSRLSEELLKTVSTFSI